MSRDREPVAFVAVFCSALIGMTCVFAPQVLFGYLFVMFPP